MQVQVESTNRTTGDAGISLGCTSQYILGDILLVNDASQHILGDIMLDPMMQATKQQDQTSPEE